MPYVVDAYGPWVAASPVEKSWNNLMKQAMQYRMMREELAQRQREHEQGIKIRLYAAGLTDTPQKDPSSPRGSYRVNPISGKREEQFAMKIPAVSVGGRPYWERTTQDFNPRIKMDKKLGVYFYETEPGKWSSGKLNKESNALIQQYNLARSQGYKGSFVDFKKEFIKDTNVTTNIIPEAGGKALAEAQAKNMIDQRPDIEGAADGLRNLYEARNLLDSKMITGTGAKLMATFGNFLSSRLGFKAVEDPVANTQAYAAAVGRQVGQIIKQFGSGTGLSDADRQYAERIAAGDVTMTEKALRKLLDINERAYRNVISRYNKKAKQVEERVGNKSLYDLTVEMPAPRSSNTAEQYLKNLGY